MLCTWQRLTTRLEDGEGEEEETVLRWRMPKKECFTSALPFSQHLSAIFFACFFDLSTWNFARLFECLVIDD